MQFLKTLFWVALAVILVLFATENWNAVTMRLWGGLEADVKLPVLILASFLLGFLPMLIVHRARLWTMRRRVSRARPPGGYPMDDDRLQRLLDKQDIIDSILRYASGIDMRDRLGRSVAEQHGCREFGRGGRGLDPEPALTRAPEKCRLARIETVHRHPVRSE